MDLSDVVSLLDDINIMDIGETIIVTKAADSSYNWQKPTVVKKSSGKKKKGSAVSKASSLTPVKEQIARAIVEKKPKRYSNPALGGKIIKKIFESSSEEEEEEEEVMHSSVKPTSSKQPLVELDDSDSSTEEEVIENFSQAVAYYK
jgi:hypothetical protein